MLAVRSNERAAAAAAINPRTVKLYAFGIAAFIAGVGGVLYAYNFGSVSADRFDAVTALSLIAFAYAGGITLISGALFAGLLSAQALIPYALDKWFGLNGNWFLLAGGVLLIFTLLRNPEGVAGDFYRRTHKRPEIRAPDVAAAVPASSAPRDPARSAQQAPARSAQQAPRAAPSSPARSAQQAERGELAGRPAVLRVTGLSVSFGGVRALRDVTLEVREGELIGLIGPNGAGKTTLVDAVSGFAGYTGRVELSGADVNGLPPYERARRGLGRTWQSTELFDDLDVRENLTVAVRDGTAARDGSGARDGSAEQTLALVGMDWAAEAMPTQLSMGQRKLVGVARALAAKPRLLCLDEPAAGLDTRESAELGACLRGLADQGQSMLLIEHDMGLVLGICDRVVVLEFGQVIADGPPQVVRTDPRVIAAYLGEGATGEGATGEGGGSRLDVRRQTRSSHRGSHASSRDDSAEGPARDSGAWQYRTDMFHADLHIHSRFSRACSKDCDIEHLSWWALRKGLTVLGTGDFTHPAWAAELKDTLVPAEPGLFRIRPELERRLHRDTPASCAGTVRFMSLGRDLDHLPARRADPEGPPPAVRAGLRGRGPHHRGAGQGRQPGLRRAAHPRARFPRPAGDHPGRGSGLLPGARARLDALVRRARVQVRLRRGAGLLRRPGQSRLRRGNRPVLGPGHELDLLVAGCLPAGQQLRRALAADAGPGGHGVRHRPGLLRDGGGVADRAGPGGHDRVLSRGGEVPPGRAPQVRGPHRAGAGPRAGGQVSRVRQAADRRRAAPGRGTGRPPARLPAGRGGGLHLPGPVARDHRGDLRHRAEEQEGDRRGGPAGRRAGPGTEHPARGPARRPAPVRRLPAGRGHRPAAAGRGDQGRRLRRGVRHHPAVPAR